MEKNEDTLLEIRKMRGNWEATLLTTLILSTFVVAAVNAPWTILLFVTIVMTAIVVYGPFF